MSKVWLNTNFLKTFANMSCLTKFCNRQYFLFILFCNHFIWTLYFKINTEKVVAPERDSCYTTKKKIISKTTLRKMECTKNVQEQNRHRKKGDEMIKQMYEKLQLNKADIKAQQ